MQSHKILPTWSGLNRFKYNGTVLDGTIICYGKDFKYRLQIRKEHYDKLISYFKGQTVKAGTSRTDPPRNSVGKWLQENVTKTAVASYVCPILIEEKYAEKVGRTEIGFF